MNVVAFSRVGHDRTRVEAAPPNIVVIVSDDRGPDDDGFLGHPHIRTPHLDRLAGVSPTFDRGCLPRPAT